MLGVSPSGKASAFGADIRRFESCHPSHRIQTVRNDGFFFIYQAFILVRMFKSKNRLFLSNIRTIVTGSFGRIILRRLKNMLFFLYVVLT